MRRSELTLEQAAARLATDRASLCRQLQLCQVLDAHGLPYHTYEHNGYSRIRLGGWQHPTLRRQQYCRITVTVPRGLNWLRTFINHRENTHVPST